MIVFIRSEIIKCKFNVSNDGDDDVIAAASLIQNSVN